MALAVRTAALQTFALCDKKTLVCRQGTCTEHLPRCGVHLCGHQALVLLWVLSMGVCCTLLWFLLVLSYIALLLTHSTLLQTLHQLWWPWPRTAAGCAG